ncbi:MAG: hypothetical protein R3A78_02375 [Polyangiales bacterium]|nr:hypothetical protein [Myxococcales bacterium]
MDSNPSAASRRPTPSALEVSGTRPRVTPPPASRRFRQVLGDSASSLMGGLEAASAVVPGGPVVSAAVRSAHGSATGAVSSQPAAYLGGQAAEAPSGDGVSPGAPNAPGYMTQFADDSMRLIMLQQQIQAENRQYTTVSNVLKTRHETAKNAIGNLR